MKAILTLVGLVCLCTLLAQAAPEKKQTCCQKAIAERTECRNKCCLLAHRNGESCQKCNPNKEDAGLLKKPAGEKSEKKAKAK